MEDQASLMGTLFEKAERYTKESIELYKLKVIDKSADMISTLSVRLALIVFIASFFSILNIGIAFGIGEILGRYSYGFFIVAGFYGLIGIMIYIFRDTWIKVYLRNSIIKHFLN